MASRTYDIGGGITGKVGWLGGIKAPKLAKEMTLAELERTADPTRFDAEKEAALGRVAQQAGAVQQAQQQDIAQQTMAGGPLAAVTGRGAMLQRELAAGAGETVAQAAPGIEAVYEQKGLAERQAAMAALYAQQDRARENAQFWADKLLPDMGDIAQIAGAVAGVAGACFVAEELYGVDDMRTHAARRYVATHDSPFLRAYRRHGRAWAAWLRRHPWAKPLVRPVWNAMAREGAFILAAEEA